MFSPSVSERATGLRSVGFLNLNLGDPSPHGGKRSGLRRLFAWNGPLVTILGLALAVLCGLVVIRLTPLGAVLFVGLGVAAVATLVEPLVGLIVALFLGPLWAYLRAEMPQVPPQIAQVFVVLTLAVWLARGMARRDLRIPCPLRGRRKEPRSRLRVSAGSWGPRSRLRVSAGSWGPRSRLRVSPGCCPPRSSLGRWAPRSRLGGSLGRWGGRSGLRGSLERWEPLLLPLLIFLAAVLLSLWDAVELSVYGVPELIKWVQILLLFLFISQHLTPRRLPWLLGALLVTGLFQAGVGIWQFGLRGEGPDHFAIFVLGDHFYRAYGTFEQPNPYAGYLGLTLPLALGAIYGTVTTWLDSGRQRLWDGRLSRGGASCSQPWSFPERWTEGRRLWRLLVYVTSATAMLAALGMSWSRGAWLGCGAAMAAMAFALPRRTRWGILLAVLLVAGGLSLYVTGLLPASVAARLTDFFHDVRFEDVRGVGINDANYAVIERLAHWQAALEMLRHNLWTGVGFGCYEPAYGDFALINWPIALGHAHNYYLNVAAETGLVGLLSYLGLWGAVVWWTWRATRQARGFPRGVAVGLLGAWTHLSVHHFLDNLYVNNVHLHIGVLLGLLAFLLRQVRQADPGIAQQAAETRRPTSQPCLRN